MALLGTLRYIARGAAEHNVYILERRARKQRLRNARLLDTSKAA